MSDTLTLAYLAGAMDCDGWFTIKRSTYHRRVRGDATNDLYSEVAGLKQVTPEIPDLLRATFGGFRFSEKGYTANSKPLHGWRGSDKVAARVCTELLPYLRVKRRQAECLVELRETKTGRYWQVSYWFAREFPNWQEMELVTTAEAASMLGYKHAASAAQAISNGTLLALPGRQYGGHITPRIPKLLVERVKDVVGKDGRARIQAPELIAWKERLWQEVRELNKPGIDGTPTYHRTGPYAFAE